MINTKLMILSISAIIFGSIYTIFRKYQSCAQLSDPDKTFNQPLIQSFFIFVGMSTVGLFKPFLKKPQAKQIQVIEQKRANIYVFIIPSVLDLVGTIVDTAGLFYTSVSVSQMLKGSVIVFTYLITIFYLKKSLSFKKHLIMLTVICSLLLIGVCNIQKQQKFQSNPVLGNVLIVLSQLLFSLMFIVQQKLLKKYSPSIISAVSWQGIWGTLICGFLILIFSQFGNQVIKCDFIQTCSLIADNGNLMFAIACTFIAIGPFNYFGMSITKQVSALYRCLVCTFRMVVVWVVSLALGWEQFSYVQLFGYVTLTVAIYFFNQQDQSTFQQKSLNTTQQFYIQNPEIGESQLQELRTLSNKKIQISKQICNT